MTGTWINRVSKFIPRDEQMFRVLTYLILLKQDSNTIVEIDLHRQPLHTQSAHGGHHFMTGTVNIGT
jgi:hypothetical protein